MTPMESSRSGGFEVYAGQVYAWAYRFLGRHHDALDVVQDVFLRWNQQCAQARPLQPRGWLRRVTLNRAIDLSRKGQPDAQTAHGTETETVSVAEGIEMLDRATLREDIASALELLTDIQRSVLVAKVYDGMTFAEIAAELSVAVSTVKTHYLRAVRAVRDRLRPKWADGVNR